MESAKITAIIAYIGGDINDITINDDSEIEIDNATYKVYTDDEADDAFREYQEQLFDDMGIESFSENFQDWIFENAIEKDWFVDAMRESYQSYIDDIRDEAGNSEDYDTRLEEEMAEAEAKDEEEFLNYLCSDYEDNEVQWYIDNFGKDQLSELVKNDSSLIDLDVIIDELQKWDGRGASLASYDGDELELDNEYYAYRI